jgi:subtilisin-like proprotein convertase family protein
VERRWISGESEIFSWYSKKNYLTSRFPVPDCGAGNNQSIKFNIMQPKFTRRDLRYFYAKMIAVAMILVASSQLSLAQNRREVVPMDNDAGLPNRPIVINDPNSPQVVCTTFTGSITGADPTHAQRFFRDGVASTCGAPKACPGSFAQGSNYHLRQWTNPMPTAQCVNITFTNTSGGTFSSFVTAYNGSFVPANVCTNYLADCGGSPAASASVTFAFNAPGGATIEFWITNVGGPGTPTGYSLTVDAPNCVPPAPCAGQPNPGNTLASVTAACPTTPVVLSLQNPTPGSGVNYQWQFSTTGAGGPWTNAGPNAASWSRTQTQPTWYRATVTCTNSGLSATSNPVFVDQNLFWNCYCNSIAGSASDEDIFNVSIGSLNNASNCATTAPGAGSVRNRYSNYRIPALAGNIVTGNMVLSVDVGTCGGNFSNGVVAWIDFNQNGVFDHPAERIYANPASSVGAHNETATVNIPASALTGITGMRVIDIEGTASALTPCGAYTWGETEDYLVNIQPCVPLPVTGPTAPLTVTGECSGVIAIPVNTGSASFPSFTWEYRVNASSPWQIASNGGLGGVITGATTGTLVLINVPSTLNGYQFRAIVSNPCSAPDFTNPPTTIIVGPLVARVSPTSATICRGSVQQLTLQSPQAQFCSGTINLAVPDFTPNGVSHTINVAGIPAGPITRLDVTINMTHTWDGDMVFVLKAPNGQILNLDYYLNTTGGSGPTTGFVNTNFTSASTTAISTGSNPYTGNWRFDAVLSGPFGQAGPNGFLPTTNNWNNLMTGNVNGGWTLAMYDGGPADLGVIQNWCITLSYGSPITGIWSQTPAPAPPNQFQNMWTNAGATIAYTGGPASTIWVTPTANTVYTVIASTVSPACTSAPVQIPVNVTQPLVSITNPANATVCRGGTTSFSTTALSAAGAPYNGPFTYQWQESRDNGLTWQNITNGGVYSGANTATLTLTGVTREAPSDMNNYRYRVIVSAPPCTGGTQTQTSASAVLTVLALPTVTISATDLALTPGQTSVITATSSPAPNATTPNWVWTRNGVVIAGATTSSVTADIDKLGVYQVSVTDVNGCRNSSNTLLIESEVSDRMWIYPNPTTGKFQVRVYYNQVYTEIRRIYIYDAQGREIMSKDFPLSNITPHYLQMDFDLTNYAGGVYVIKAADILGKKHVQGILIKQ